MTTDTAARQPKPNSDDEKEFVGWVLGARRNAAVRSSLRRGLTSAGARYSEPYLAKFWANAPWLREPITVFAAIAASTTLTSSTSGLSVGQLASALDKRGRWGAKSDSDPLNPGERKLALLQNQGTPHLRRFLVDVVQAAEQHQLPVDWFSVWRACRDWQHPNRSIRRNARRKLLEQYWQTPKSQPPVTPVSSATPSP